MTLYNVHLLPICRVKISNIEAGSHDEALEKAWTKFNEIAPDLFPDQSMPIGIPDVILPMFVENCGYNDEDNGALVDVVGDQQNEQSRWYDAEGKPADEASK